MKRIVQFTRVTTLLVLASTLLAFSIARACSKCDGLGNCVPAGPGEAGWVICNPDPADQLCDVAYHCHGLPPGEPEATVVTNAVLLRGPSDAIHVLLPDGVSQRQLHLRRSDPDLPTVLHQLAGLTGTDPAGWALAYWHTTVTSEPVPLRVASESGAGYVVEPAALIGATRLQVWPADRSHREGIDARLTPSDVLLVRRTIDGKDYVLAIRAVSVAASDPQYLSRLIQAQHSFKSEVLASPTSDLLALSLSHDEGVIEP